MKRQSLLRHARRALLLALAGACLGWTFTAYLSPAHLVDLLAAGSLCG